VDSRALARRTGAVGINEINAAGVFSTAPEALSYNREACRVGTSHNPKTPTRDFLEGHRPPELFDHAEGRLSFGGTRTRWFRTKWESHPQSTGANGAGTLRLTFTIHIARRISRTGSVPDDDYIELARPRISTNTRPLPGRSWKRRPTCRQSLLALQRTRPSNTSATSSRC